MKTFADGQQKRSPQSSSPVQHLSRDLIPYVDKPRVRRVVGTATIAGGLCLGASSGKGEAATGPFSLRSVDSVKEIIVDVVYVGEARPQLADVDGDGDLDLVQIVRQGCGPDVPPQVYINTSTSLERKFKPGRDFDAGGAVANTSYSVMADFDGDGDNDKAELKTGVYFENVGSDGEPDLVERTGLANPLEDLGFTPLEAVDLNGDGFADLVDRSLGVHENVEHNGARGFALEPMHSFQVPGGDTNEVTAVLCGDLDGDGDLDALVFDKYDDGAVQSNHYLENIGDRTRPDFVYRGPGLPADTERGILGGVPGAYSYAPQFADVDGDGDLDAKIGSNGFFRNVGTPTQPVFVEDDTMTRELFNGFPNRQSADLDRDGILEDYTAEPDGSIQSSMGVPLGDFKFSSQPSLSFVDVDNDGDDDLFVADRCRLYFLENGFAQQNGPDSDGDSLPDTWENAYFGNLYTYDGNQDPDGDGLANLAECINHTNPMARDTDGDGYLDVAEVRLGTSPVIPALDPPITLTPSSPSPSVNLVTISASSVRLRTLFPLGFDGQLVHSSNLEHWSVLDPEVTGTGDQKDLVVSRSALEPVGFYTIKPNPEEPH